MAERFSEKYAGDEGPDMRSFWVMLWAQWARPPRAICVLMLVISVAILCVLSIGRIALSNGAIAPLHRPNGILHPLASYQPYCYYGGLRGTNDPVLVVVGTKKFPSAQFFLWLFYATPDEDWTLKWSVPLTGALYQHVTPFTAEGDDTKQVAIATGGADWQGVTLFGFRGRDYRPKQLLSTVTHADDVTIEASGNKTEIVEHYTLEVLKHWGLLRRPLPPSMNGRRYACRYYIYDATTDSYKGPTLFVPDPQREGPKSTRSFSGTYGTRVALPQKRRLTR